MGRSRTFADGSTIEIRASGNGNPPDSPSWMQHTNASTLWLRCDGGTWRRVVGSRSSHGAWEWIAAAETAAEALEALEATGALIPGA